MAASPARPDTEVVFDPATYTGGVPFAALTRLRREVRELRMERDIPKKTVAIFSEPPK